MTSRTTCPTASELIDAIDDELPNPSHEWFVLRDPGRKKRIWLFDVTFLLSSWSCLYGKNCRGIDDRPVENSPVACCQHGVYFLNQKDLRRTERAARRLRADDWQFHAYAQRKGFFCKAEREEGKWWYKTRVVDGACIFLNRPGFGAGSGCALHQHASREGLPPAQVKPDVCWMVPLRRIDDRQRDGTTIVLLHEWSSAAWSDGEEELRWWCTETPEAYTGTHRVYRSCAEELKQIIGDDAVYAKLVAELARRESTLPAPKPHRMEKLARKRARR